MNDARGAVGRSDAGPITPPASITEAEARTGVKLSVLRQLCCDPRPRFAASRATVGANGFATAFLKLGRAVHVDVSAFMAAWRSKQAAETRGRHD